MLTKTKKKILLIAVPVFLLIAIPMLIYWLEYGPKPLVNELPDEEIVSVVRVDRKTNPLFNERIEIELPQGKIGSFFDLVKRLKYKKRFNPLRYMDSIDDRVYYTITYDNYRVKLGEHYLGVYNNNGNGTVGFQISAMRPNGAFAEIDKLFLEE